MAAPLELFQGIRGYRNTPVQNHCPTTLNTPFRMYMSMKKGAGGGVSLMRRMTYVGGVVQMCENATVPHPLTGFPFGLVKRTN